MNQSINYCLTEGEDVRLKHLKDPKAFIKNSSDMNDANKNINEYNPRAKPEIKTSTSKFH